MLSPVPVRACRVLAAVLPLAPFALSPDAFAQAAAGETLETVVVTAHRTPGPLSAVLGDVCDAVWLPGGHPEPHAARLAQRGALRAQLAAHAAAASRSRPNAAA